MEEVWVAISLTIPFRVPNNIFKKKTQIKTKYNFIFSAIWKVKGPHKGGDKKKKENHYRKY